MKVGKDEWRETERGEQNFKRKKRENMVCRNLPYDGSVGEKPKERLPKRRTRGSRHHCSFEENVRKTKKRSGNFENKGSGVVYTWGRY